MRRIAAVLLAALVAACSLVENTARPQPERVAAAVCTARPDGSPVIGERGLGGTGLTSQDVQTADRGIGGTGIVGVITGFASICVNEAEIAYDAATPVTSEGQPVEPDALRAGQVVVIEAGGEDPPRARKVAIVYQVSGPVESVGDARIQVAGQPVSLAAAEVRLPGDGTLHVGDWVEVSGLRAPGGDIEASRVDRRPPGTAIVRGRVIGKPGAYRIGDLKLRLSPGAAVTLDQPMVAKGRYRNGVLVAASVSPDLVAADPTALFGPGVIRFSIEAYVRQADDRIVSVSGWTAEATARLSTGIAHDRPAIVELERGRDGTVSTRGLHNLSDPLGHPDRARGGDRMEQRERRIDRDSAPGADSSGPFGNMGPGMAPGGFGGFPGGGSMGGGRPGR
jgi:hypothetical protein